MVYVLIVCTVKCTDTDTVTEWPFSINSKRTSSVVSLGHPSSLYIRQMQRMDQVAQMLRAVVLFASLQGAIGSCIFCDTTYSYDLSLLPTTTFTAHSGTRGSTTDPYRRYIVSSPCATPQSDLCMTHPTSDPLQMRNKQGNLLYTICTGLGTLNATTRVTARGAKGLTVTLHQSKGIFSIPSARASARSTPRRG